MKPKPMRDTKDLLDYETYPHLDTYQIRFVEGTKSETGSAMALVY